MIRTATTKYATQFCVSEMFIWLAISMKISWKNENKNMCDNRRNKQIQIESGSDGSKEF
jgi:hypothetical protein